MKLYKNVYSCNLLLFQGAIKPKYIKDSKNFVVTYYYFKVQLNFKGRGKVFNAL